MEPKDFPERWKRPQNSRRQVGDTKHNIIRPGEMAPRICAPLMQNEQATECTY